MENSIKVSIFLEYFPNRFCRCPPDMTKPLPVGSSSVYVMFPQPKTNVDWFRSDRSLSSISWLKPTYRKDFYHDYP